MEVKWVIQSDMHLIPPAFPFPLSHSIVLYEWYWPEFIALVLLEHVNTRRRGLCAERNPDMHPSRVNLGSLWYQAKTVNETRKNTLWPWHASTEGSYCSNYA